MFQHQPILVMIILITCTLAIGCGASAGAGETSEGVTGAAAEKEAGMEIEAASYLPLARGRKWVLRSRTMETPVVLEVLEQSGDRARLKFDNPWLRSELSLRSHEGKHYVTALTINGQTAALPDETLYFDLTARNGAKWSNEIGTMNIVTRHKTVQANGQTYTNCVQIRETNKEGNKLYWTFAPGVGFVQFGEDSWGFFLDPKESNLTGHPASSGELSPDTPAPASSRSGTASGKVLIGLAANPTASEGLTPRSVGQRFTQSIEAGVTFIYFAPKWNEIEPSPANYNFKDLDYHATAADQARVPLVLNLRVIDTNQRSMPADLTGAKFSDAKLHARLSNLINAIVPRLKDRTTLFMIGNEVNSYFDSRQGEISDYLTLYRAGARRLKELVPGAQTSVNFTFEALGALNAHLKPLFDESDFLSLTYYPANPDFTFRDPDVVDAEFERIVREARGKRILLQEVGYASSPLNNSSEEKQARFYAKVFDNLRRNRAEFIGANFLFMSDLPDETVEGFAEYYKMPNAERFKAFLKTLGMFDDGGKAKKSWEVFRMEAKMFK